LTKEAIVANGVQPSCGPVPLAGAEGLSGSWPSRSFWQDSQGMGLWISSMTQSGR
jgi:hypothetical protein